MLWELLNTPETAEDFTKAWTRFCKKATFPQMLQAYDLVAGLAEADATTADKFERIVFLPAHISRDEWIATYGRDPESARGADA